MVVREEVFESTAQYPLFRYSIPMLPVVPEQVAEKCHAATPAAKAVMKTSCLTQR